MLNDARQICPGEKFKSLPSLSRLLHPRIPCRNNPCRHQDGKMCRKTVVRDDAATLHQLALTLPKPALTYLNARPSHHVSRSPLPKSTSNPRPLQASNDDIPKANRIFLSTSQIRIIMSMEPTPLHPPLTIPHPSPNILEINYLLSALTDGMQRVLDI
jgi:hypothetical protein